MTIWYLQATYGEELSTIGAHALRIGFYDFNTTLRINHCSRSIPNLLGHHPQQSTTTTDDKPFSNLAIPQEGLR